MGLESFTDWLTGPFRGLFSALQSFGQFVMEGNDQYFAFCATTSHDLLLTIAAFFVSSKKWGLTAFYICRATVFIYNQGLWTDLMNTVTLVLLSSSGIDHYRYSPRNLNGKKRKGAKHRSANLRFHANDAWLRLSDPSSRFLLGSAWYQGFFASVIFALPPTVTDD